MFVIERLLSRRASDKEKKCTPTVEALQVCRYFMYKSRLQSSLCVCEVVRCEHVGYDTVA